MNISIFASIGAQNLGDELILKNEIELLRQEFGEDTRFQVASYDPKNPVFHIKNTQYFEYFPFGMKNPRNFLRNIQNLGRFFSVLFWSDIIVIGGGGIIYDSEIQSVKNPLHQWIFRAECVRLFRKKMYFYAIGIDIKQEENFKKGEKIFKNAWKITVRDEKSQLQLRRAGFQSEIVDDPVMRENFSSHEKMKRGEKQGNILKTLFSGSFSLKDFEDIDFQGKQVGLALRKGYIGKNKNPELEILLIEELCEFIEKKGGNILFLPHSFHKTDLQVNDFMFLQQFLTPQRKICKNLQEVYNWYQDQKGASKIIISMRLHSIILAFTYGIPQIILSYSQKTDELIKKLRK